MTLVRSIRRVAGSPRIWCACGRPPATAARRPAVTVGSSHIRYVMPGDHAAADDRRLAHRDPRGAPFFLERHADAAARPRRDRAERRAGSRPPLHRGDGRVLARLGAARSRIPFEWQDAVIRAAITLKLNAYDDTGAIVAAMTTSIPEAAGSRRNWDYRYCWLRDGYFVVDALNRLGATDTMERYLGYIVERRGRSRPTAAAAGLPRSTATRRSPRTMVDVAARLPRHGPGARRQRRLPAGPARRLRLGGPRGDPRVLRRAAGATAATRAVRPPRSRSATAARRCSTSPTPACGSCAAAPRVHTFSSVMCWAACDRWRASPRGSGLAERARLARASAARIQPLRRRALLERAARAAFVATRRRRGARREPAAARTTSASSTADDPRFAAHRARGRARAEARRLRLPLRRARRFRRARERLPRLHVLVRQRAGARSAAATRRASCSSGCSPAATGMACSPSTSTRAPASTGAISCRPTAWSA